MKRITTMLAEYMLEHEKDQLPGPEIDKRAVALRELGGNWHTMNTAQFAEAMTTAHFANYFADALDRAFVKDYQTVQGSWRQYTYADTVPDFRDVDRYRMSTPGTLLRRREKAQPKHAGIVDTEIHYGVEEYARAFYVSWQAILNDDLGKIRETPAAMARAAAMFEDQFVSALYDNATTQATLAALGAPWAITGRLTAANLAIAINAMVTRTDAAGNPIVIPGLRLVIPPVLQIQAATILADILSYGGDNSNLLANYIKGVHVDPYVATAAPNIPWYLFADPQAIPAVTVARLAGAPGPWTYMEEPNVRIISGSAPTPFALGAFQDGDIHYAVEDVIGGWDSGTLVGVTDFRGLLYSSGTTP